MSRLLGAATTTRQPQVPVGIARGNPLARSLVFAHNGATVLDHARGVRPTLFPYNLYWWNAAAPLVDGAAGTEKGDFVGPQQEGVQATGYPLNYQNFPAIGSSVTLFARASVDSNFGNGGFIFSFADGTNDVGVEVGLGASNIAVWIANTTGNWVNTAGPSYADNDIIDIAVVIDAGSPAKVYTSLSNTVCNSAANYSNVNAAGSAMCIGAYNIAGNGPLVGIVGCALAWERALSEREVGEVMRNPWQVFAPLRRVVLPVPAIAPPQLLAPVSDVAAGGWTPSSGSDLYAMVDETVASDADYIYATSAATCALAFGSGGDPNTSAGHILRYRLLPGTGNVSVTLKQASTTIASWGPHELSGVAQDFAQTLSAGQADSITDYTALRAEFTAS